MPEARPVPKKSLRALAAEWDAIAEARLDQIASGSDLSMTQVLLPSLKQLIPRTKGLDVIDVGCGTGYVTQELAKLARSIVGVDMSRRSIEVARSHYGRRSNIEFVAATVQNYAARAGGRKFSLAVANMTFMATVNLRSLLAAVRQLLAADGTLVFTITHPWFWADYWHYSSAPWFHYSEELAIEAPFKISLAETLPRTTHVHRPLAMYVAELAAAGFAIDAILEPMPSTRLARAYPFAWKYPRFLAMRCLVRSPARRVSVLHRGPVARKR
jgi:SAM-dependent methyltransferase